MNTNYEKDFVPYEQALALKELGFDEPCFGRYYYKESYPMLNPQSEETELVFEFGQYIKQTKVTILAPLYQQAFRWFREKYGLRNSITDFIDDETGIEWDYEIAIIGTDVDEKGNYNPIVDYSTDDETRKFKTYEEAELACLKKLIELTFKTKNK